MKNNSQSKPISDEYSKRERQMLVRLTSDELEAFKEAASLKGIPLSAWVRERLRYAATRELEEASLPIPFLK